MEALQEHTGKGVPAPTIDCMTRGISFHLTIFCN
jgi:hypothetical protein